MTVLLGGVALAGDFSLQGQSIAGSGVGRLSTLPHAEVPSKVDSLMLRQMNYRLSHPDQGYRILIFSQSGNNSKSAAIQARSEFELFHPGCKAYISFEEPYFKVKVGNFYNRFEADLFLRTIKSDYPYAFIVKDVLNIVDYLKLGE